MKPILPLLSSLLVFASCSTAYQSGQTPDDVYFSPARPQQEYVQVQDDDNRSYRRGTDYNKTDDDYYSYNDDRYLRMKIRNRNQWAYLDDYYRDPYAYNYYNKYSNNYYYNGYGYSNPRGYWNSYYNPYMNSYYNGHYSPYGGHVIVVAPRTPIKSTPRTFNLHVFDSPQNSTNNRVPDTRSRRYNSNTNRSYTTPSRNTGNDLRDTYRRTENSNRSSETMSTQKSVTPPPASSNSNKSSGNSNAPRRKF